MVLVLIGLFLCNVLCKCVCNAFTHASFRKTKLLHVLFIVFYFLTQRDPCWTLVVMKCMLCNWTSNCKADTNLRAFVNFITAIMY